MGKKVNFLEAVNSGQRFRPVNCSNWYGVTHDNSVRCLGVGIVLTVNHLDFYNSDFEIEEKSITLTETEFDEIFNKVEPLEYTNTDYGNKSCLNDFKTHFGWI